MLRAVWVFVCIAFPSVSWALVTIETACVTLGANCVASEPLDTATYTVVTTGYYASNASPKPANLDGDGAVISNSSGFPASPITSGAAITALPAGHTITYVLKEPDGGGDTQFIGHMFASTDPKALRSFRFYRYYSSDHFWTGDGGVTTCNSGKTIQISQVFAGSGGPYFDFGINNGVGMQQDVTPALGWSQTQAANCCNPAPGGDSTALALTRSAIVGRWWRFEFILHNADTTGASTYWEIYVRNVTDNLPEFKWVDSRQTMTTGPDASFWWQSPMTDNLHPSPGQVQSFAINPFRNNAGTPCTGYIAHTAALWAAWSTDAGQRIGAAVEVEGTGGGGGTTPTGPGLFNPRFLLLKANYVEMP